MTTLTQITVPFHGSELFIVEHHDQPYTPMKPIVEGMGLAWTAQHEKLKQRFKSTITEIVMVANDGKERMMTCLPVRKLFGWLMTISPNKVRPEMRDKVIMYQNECDDVLWSYWVKGQAVNPRSNKKDRVPLKDAVTLMVAKAKFLNYADAYKMVHQAFCVEHIDEIPLERLPEAVAYVHRLMGEYAQKVERMDPETHSFNLLAAKTTNSVMDYLHDLQKEITRLGGALPMYPAFDKEAIVRAIVTRMVDTSRMLLTLSPSTGRPSIQFIPNDCWILHDDNIAQVVADPAGVAKKVLPDIIKAAANRLA